MEKKYHGIIPPIITPIDGKENVKEDEYRAILNYCIDGGLHGIFVAGTNGETMALTQAERDRAIRITVDEVAGRVPVVAGVMDTSTRRVVDNIRRAEQAGCNCMAVTPIFYDRHTSQDETVRHFERILSQTEAELIIYNIPTFTGLKIMPDTVSRIIELDRKRIVAYKDSSGAYGDFMKVLAKYKDSSISLMQGATGLALSAVLMGADGFVPAVAPAFPQLFVSAYEAAKSGNVALTWEYDKLLQESSKILGLSKNATAATKYAISLRGLTGKEVIWPQDYTLPEDEEKIRRKVDEVDAMYAQLKEREKDYK